MAVLSCRVGEAGGEPGAASKVCALRQPERPRAATGVPGAVPTACDACAVLRWMLEIRRDAGPASLK